MIKNLIISMRPKQWYKNALIFIGLVFSPNLLNQDMWLKSGMAFITFCLLSSGIYLLNDVLDVKADREHPTKRKRPIASGKLKVYCAVISSVVFILSALLMAYWINFNVLYISIGFLVLNLGYSFKLKRVLFVDTLIIAVDFTIRAVAGCLAIGVEVSPWITICAFLLALLLVFSKRRNEVILLDAKADKHRLVLSDYSVELCNQIIGISSSALIVSYCLYTFHTSNLWMMTTIPIVVYGILRYLWLVKKNNMGGEPEKAMKDNGILLSILVWASLCVGILYIEV